MPLLSKIDMTIIDIKKLIILINNYKYLLLTFNNKGDMQKKDHFEQVQIK